MPHVLISGRIDESGLALLRARADLTVQELPEDRTEDLAAHLPGADALILRGAKLCADLLPACGRLRLVSRHGVGYDNVPVDALTAAGIPLTLVGDVNSGSVAEHAFFMMLALAKQGFVHDSAARAGDWNKRYSGASTELAGRTLLILGLGKIGRELARRALAFDMRVLGFARNTGAADMAAIGVTRVEDWRAALGAADFVSLHVPRTTETEHMIGKAEFAAMKRSAYLLNASRGGLVDEAALCVALETGEIAGAAMDAFEREPLPSSSPLLAARGLILSPHMAGLTMESAKRLSVAAVQNVLDFIDGRLDRRNVVNPAALA